MNMLLQAKKSMLHTQDPLQFRCYVAIQARREEGAIEEHPGNCTGTSKH
jgi:hypothetical protein